MRRLTSALFAVSLFALLRSDSAAERDRLRAADAMASARLAAWFGGAAPRPASMPAPKYWLLSVVDVEPDTAVARGEVEQYTSGLFDDDALGNELATHLTNRLQEEIFQKTTVSTSGAGFPNCRYFGRIFPYAVRSIRIQPAELEPSDTFTALERVLGRPTFDAILRGFYAAHAGRRVPVATFVREASEASGRDLQWLFDATRDSARTTDYGVGEVIGSLTAGGRHRTTVVVRRYGDVVFPGTGRKPVDGFEAGEAVAVETTFADGRRRTDRWDGRDRWTMFVYESAAPVVSVVVDPDRVVAGDHRRTNNSWTRSPMAWAAANKWSARWMTWLQGALLNWAFFA